MVEHLTTLLERTTVVPAVNQIEVHPYFQQRQVQTLRAEHGIVTQAWSPIAASPSTATGSTAAPCGTRSSVASPRPAARHLQQGRSVIPKSTKPQRIAENIDVFDFELSTEELAAIDTLDTGQRGGPEPESITLESSGRPIPED
jgi:diketogulonate reductase-like aldo/keto reductase